LNRRSPAKSVDGLSPLSRCRPAARELVGPAAGRGAKRTGEDIAAMSQRLITYVKANPGLRVEQINKALGTTTKDLALPIRKLLADNVLSSKGQKRSTTYFPGRKTYKA
jgi:hypothetical protein